MHADIPLLLFAKAPIAGKVKTRLTSHCSDQQAADLAKILIQASLEKVVAAWPGQVYLSVWLDQDHPFFGEMVNRYPIKMTSQCDGDLGEKMRHALANFGYPAAVMGCDAPHVSEVTLQQAYQKLASGQSVIGPAKDGGYYLLGLTRDADSLFIDKPWGGEKVLEQTLACAEQAELQLDLLDSLNDVDEWSDLLQLADSQAAIHDYLNKQDLI